MTPYEMVIQWLTMAKTIADGVLNGLTFYPTSYREDVHVLVDGVNEINKKPESSTTVG